MNGTLCAEGLVVDFGARRVLDAVSCRFDRGWTAVIGPNGAGKSTLLRVLAGLLLPARGSVQLDAQPLNSFDARTRGRSIAWLAQGNDVTGELTARETVALGRLPHTGVFGALSAADDTAIDAAIAATECRDWQHRRLAALSGGERQRVLLARALATEANVLLLDEPTTHLDPPHQVALVRLARRLAATHTVVTVLHDLPLALAADRVLLLDQGRVSAEGEATDPGLLRAVESSFGDALRLFIESGRVRVEPRLED